ncbi:helix-turn-helix transcriptional regulator [Streptomyces sp. NPDC102437]|uniref:helix-turn-helix transcriptional regulator n=1 Tax=Streptomyces sp. NPDC102437 TaxID=3366175 RepID=UPI0037F9A4E9
MSTEAVTWAMDDAPMLLTDKGKPDTTSRHVLQALAEHAHKDGGGAHPSVVRIQYRTGYDRRTVQRALRRLEAGGLIQKTGETGGRTIWKLALHLKRPATDWADLERLEEDERRAAAERQRRSRAKRVTHSASVTVTDSPSVTDGDVTHSPSVSHALEQRDVTHSASARHALNAALTTNQPSVEPPENPSVVDEGGHTSGSGDPSPRPDGPLPMAPIDLDGFTLTAPMRRWATATVPGLDPDHETAQFVAHFRADGGRRRSWPDEWQKWVLRSAKWAAQRATNVVALPPRPSTTDTRVQAAIAAGRRLQAAADAQNQETQ